MTAGPEELRPHVRPEHITGDELLVVRGGPDTAAKLAGHARRMHRAYVLDGEPLFGISVFAPSTTSARRHSTGSFSGRMATYRHVYVPAAGTLASGRLRPATDVPPAARHGRARLGG